MLKQDAFKNYANLTCALSRTSKHDAKGAHIENRYMSVLYNMKINKSGNFEITRRWKFHGGNEDIKNANVKLTQSHLNTHLCICVMHVEHCSMKWKSGIVFQPRNMRKDKTPISALNAEIKNLCSSPSPHLTTISSSKCSSLTLIHFSL